MTASVLQLPLWHISMQFSDNRAQKAHDAELIFKRAKARQVLAVQGTEAGDKVLADLLSMNSHANGFEFYRPGGQACWIAINKNFPQLKQGPNFDWSGVIVDGVSGKWPNKGVLTATMRLTDKDVDYGKLTTSVSHLLTKGRPEATLATYRRYVSENRKIAKAIAAEAREHVKGSNCFLYSGDQNIIDRLRKTDTFFGYPLTSCWDELGKWPRTNPRAGNIDVWASWDKDHRMKCLSARVMNDSAIRLYTDHYLVEAVYGLGALILGG